MFVDTDMSFLVVKRKGNNFNILTKAATTILEFEIVERQFQVTSNFFSISHTKELFQNQYFNKRKKRDKNKT